MEGNGQNGKKHRGNTDGLCPPWQKGQSGNPAGRPKRKTLTEIWHEILDEPVPEKPDSTYRQAFARALLDMAHRGNKTAIAELLARIEPVQKQVAIDMTLSESVQQSNAMLDRMREEFPSVN